MTFEIGWWDGVRLLSVVVNVVLTVLWIKQRIVLKTYLAGRWQGTLVSEQNPQEVYKCTLYVADHRGKDNTAHLYYRWRDLETGTDLSKGLDEMIVFGDEMFVFGRRWAPHFARVLHKEAIHPNGDRPRTGKMPVRYKWDCEILHFLFLAKMKVDITVIADAQTKDCTFSGTLEKD